MKVKFKQYSNCLCFQQIGLQAIKAHQVWGNFFFQSQLQSLYKFFGIIILPITMIIITIKICTLKSCKQNVYNITENLYYDYILNFVYAFYFVCYAVLSVIIYNDCYYFINRTILYRSFTASDTHGNG